MPLPTFPPLAPINYKQLSSSFHPLVYAFDPEASVNFQDLNKARYLLHRAGQYHDLYQAYCYMQNLLQEIKIKGLAELTPDQIVMWIKEIHRRIASTLILCLRERPF